MPRRKQSNTLPEKPDDTVSPAWVAAQLDVSTQTLLVWRKARKHLPFTQIGNSKNSQVRYRRGDVEALIKRSRVGVEPVEGKKGDNDGIK